MFVRYRTNHKIKYSATAARVGILVRSSLVEIHMAYTLPRFHARQQPMPRTLVALHCFPSGLTPLHIAVLRARDVSTQFSGSPLQNLWMRCLLLRRRLRRWGRR